jgi:hypothetical protein
VETEATPKEESRRREDERENRAVNPQRQVRKDALILIAKRFAGIEAQEAAMTSVDRLGFLKPTGHGFTYFGVVDVHYAHVALLFPVVLIVYYLVWKYLIGFFNQVAGIAEL